MTKVWEDYVKVLIEQALPAGHALSTQHPVLLTDDSSRIQASADLVVLDSNRRPVDLFDAKYKHWGAKPRPDEIYQVLTYAYRLGLKEATLLYPGRGEQEEVVAGEYRIRTVGVDVLAPLTPLATGLRRSAPGRT